MYQTPIFLPAGDQSLVIELGDAISPEINNRVHNLLHALVREGVPGVIDLVPSYRSLLVQFDPVEVSPSEMRERIEIVAQDIDERTVEQSRVVEIPVLYGGDYGPDIDFVAEHTGLDVEEVIALHSGVDYLVYMIGFSPGFPYLGGLPDKLVTPRLDTPRVEIPAGSVGIAEAQTGVYTVASPGGWRLIGRTPVGFFDPSEESPSLLRAGDCVRFVPLSGEEGYLEIAGMVERGEYQVSTEAAE